MKSNKAVVKLIGPKVVNDPKVVNGPKTKDGTDAIAPLVQQILVKLGENPDRDGLLKTPERVATALRFLTSGYQTDIAGIVNGAFYEVKYDEMVVVKDIEFFSLCEHHMLPFY